MVNYDIDNIIISALKEDTFPWDITTDNLIDESSESKAIIKAKEFGIIAGIEVAKRVFTLLNMDIYFDSRIKDGETCNNGEIIAEVSGNTRSLLKAERTALNFLQRMSGIATKTNEFCKKVEGYNVRIVDTRKTVPGLRILDKYAVKIGGGHNHRFSLSDGVLIKDNHIKAAGGIRQAIDLVKYKVPHTIKIEIEAETLEQVQEALESGADIIMLDNMGIDMMKKAVKFVNKRGLLEASGNISLNNVSEVASTGVDIISIGSLTHSVSALDISMKIY